MHALYDWYGTASKERLGGAWEQGVRVTGLSSFCFVMSVRVYRLVSSLNMWSHKELPLLFRTRLLLEVKALPQHVQTKGGCDCSCHVTWSHCAVNLID